MYKKQEWNNGTRLDAYRLNYMEQGIYDCSKQLEELSKENSSCMFGDFASKESLQDIDEKFSKVVQELLEAMEKQKKEITALKTKITKLAKKSEEDDK